MVVYVGFIEFFIVFVEFVEVTIFEDVSSRNTKELNGNMLSPHFTPDIYSNLQGCGGERVYYDGCSMIIVK